LSNDTTRLFGLGGVEVAGVDVAGDDVPMLATRRGRSGPARVSWPRRRSSSSKRCQYHPTSPPPWISTKVATVVSIPRIAITYQAIYP
jgi:hypothetical protein